MKMNVSRRDRAVFVHLLIILLPITAFFFAQPPPGAPAGIPVCADVHLSGSLLMQPVRVELIEMWRYGGPEDEQILGRIADVVADTAGVFCFLDSKLKTVHAYDADGSYRGVVAAEETAIRGLRHWEWAEPRGREGGPMIVR